MKEGGESIGMYIKFEKINNSRKGKRRNYRYETREKVYDAFIDRSYGN